MSDTPRTDAFKRTVGQPWWEFAGGLERELAASQAGQAVPEPCRATCRLDHSIFAILCLYEVEELTEGQAVKLMNCAGRVEFRLLREKLHRNFCQALAADMQAHGWQWQEAKKAASPLDEPPSPA